MSFDPVRYVRRIGGITKGEGSFANLVAYATEAGDTSQEGGASITYQAAGNNEGAFLVRERGIYSVSVSYEITGASILEIRTGGVPDSTVSNGLTRARVDRAEVTDHDGVLTWIGLVEAGDFIWVINTGTDDSDVDHNQISIAQLA